MGLAQFDSRKTYFDGAGTPITGFRKTEQAIKLAKLDWDVDKRPIYLADGTPVENFFCNVKSDDGTQLGVVGKDYGIVSNRDAFDFIDSMIEGGADIECAGSYKDLKKTFIVAKTDPLKILGDDFQPYILVTNSFDGSGAVQAMFTPVRVFCSNCLVVANKQAPFKIPIRHSRNVLDRLQIARDTLLQNSKYLDYLKTKSETWATTKFTKADFTKHVIPAVLDKMGVNNIKERKRNKNREEEVRHELMKAYTTSDLGNYSNTAYRAIQAVADYESHAEPARNTDNPQLYMQRVAVGMVLLNAAIQAISARSSVKRIY